MEIKNVGLEALVKACDFQNLQDKVASATKIACITVDYAGVPVTNHSNCSNFCKAVRENPKLKSLCEKCDSRGGLESARLKQPYMYICHMGIVDFAIPIIYQNLYIGAVMGGQLLISDLDATTKLEYIISEQSNINFSAESQILFQDLPVFKKADVEENIKMINYICNYRMVNVLSNLNLTQITPTPFKRINKTTSIIQPALDFIENNYHNTIKLSYLASLCDISPSYFSKLFKRITNKNLVNYINNLRIEKAKHLLLTTDKPISIIAFECGFEDSGYFIKVFKSITSLTPANYRDINSI